VKRYGQLFELFCEFKNLALAAQKAQLGKRFKGSVSNFNFYLEQNLLTLQKELRDGTYRCGTYTILSARVRLLRCLNRNLNNDDWNDNDPENYNDNGGVVFSTQTIRPESLRSARPQRVCHSRVQTWSGVGPLKRIGQSKKSPGFYW
jgi:hypothetical protein